MQNLAGNGAAAKCAPCRPLTQSEQDAVLAHLTGPRDRGLFIIGCASGFRISGLISLTIGDARGALAANRLFLRAQSNKGKRAGHSVALRPEAADAIRAILADRADDPDYAALFESRKGGGIKRAQAYRILRTAFEAANLSGLELPGLLGCHAMRKVFAKRVYLAATAHMIASEGACGEAIELTRRALGHRDLGATLAYLPVDVRDVDAAVLA